MDKVTGTGRNTAPKRNSLGKLFCKDKSCLKNADSQGITIIYSEGNIWMWSILSVISLPLDCTLEITLMLRFCETEGNV